MLHWHECYGVHNTDAYKLSILQQDSSQQSAGQGAEAQDKAPDAEDEVGQGAPEAEEGRRPAPEEVVDPSKLKVFPQVQHENS